MNLHHRHLKLVLENLLVHILQQLLLHHLQLKKLVLVQFLHYFLHYYLEEDLLTECYLFLLCVL
tara:strand:- start:224 stop:415 length:192 start_codon:yes stop_codon:yes gene_type:complete